MDCTYPQDRKETHDNKEKVYIFSSMKICYWVAKFTSSRFKRQMTNVKNICNILEVKLQIILNFTID